MSALSRRSVLSGIGAGALFARAATRAAEPDFYRGKTLTVIVGFAPGGGVDTTARIVAQHLVDFIPGRPRLVVQNLEGAAGLMATNHIETQATADGLTLAVPGRSWFVEGVVKSPGVHFDPAKLAYIGSPGAVNSVLFLRAATGITSFDALKSARKPITVGALASNTPTAMIPVMLAGQGVPIRVVAGYGSSARILIALEQGEVDGFFTVEDTFARRQDLIARKIVVPILQNKPVHPGIPVLRDVLPKKDAALITLVMALESFGLPLVGPSATPEDRVALLRNAFAAMARDPAYQNDARKVDMPVGAPISGAELTQMVRELATLATPAIVAQYRRLAAGLKV